MDSHHVLEGAVLDGTNVIGSRHVSVDVGSPEEFGSHSRRKALNELESFIERSSTDYPGYKVRSINMVGGFSEDRAMALMRNEVARTTFNRLRGDPLLLCLTTNPTSRLMWDFYASGGRGFVLGFRSGSDFLQPPVASEVSEVMYSEAPSRGPAAVGDWRRWLIKHTDYQFEQEWRCQYSQEHTRQVSASIGEINVVGFKKSDVCDAIFGPRACEALIDEVRGALGDGPRYRRLTVDFPEFGVEDLSQREH